MIVNVACLIFYYMLNVYAKMRYCVSDRDSIIKAGVCSDSNSDIKPPHHGFVAYYPFCKQRDSRTLPHEVALCKKWS